MERGSKTSTTLVYSPFVSQEFAPFLTNPNRADLEFLGELMQAGEIRP